MEAGIDRRTITGLALGGDAQRIIEEFQRTRGCLSGITLLERIRQVQQRPQPCRLADNQVPEVTAQRQHEMQGVEALVQDLVEGQQGGGVVLCQEGIHQLERVFIVKDVEVADDVGVVDFLAAESHGLVEYREGVPHRTVGLGRYHVQGFIVDGDALPGRYTAQIAYYVGDTDAVEIVGLAAAQYGRDDLVLFRGRQDEYGMCGRLLQCLEEGVERRLAEHVHLIYDIDAVTAHLRRYLHLVQQGLDVVYAIVGGGIQLVYAV